MGGRQEERIGAEPDPPQALCPGDSPQHKDLPGELVVRELFSSVLQEICDEVGEEGWGAGGRERSVLERGSAARGPALRVELRLLWACDLSLPCISGSGVGG